MLGDLYLIFLPHPLELLYARGVEFLQMVKDDTVADPMLGTQQIGEAIAYGVRHSYLGIGDAHPSGVGSHHQFIIAFGVPACLFYIDLLAELQRLFPIRLAEFIEKGPLQAFDAM